MFLTITNEKSVFQKLHLFKVAFTGLAVGTAQAGKNLFYKSEESLLNLPHDLRK
jgi:hypothetical protein